MCSLLVSKGSSFYFCREVCWLDLQLYLKAYELATSVCSFETTKLYTSILYRTCIFPLASPPTSLLSSLPILEKKKQPCRWEWHCNTFTSSLHFVPFCQLCTPWNSLHVQWPIFTPTKWMHNYTLALYPGSSPCRKVGRTLGTIRL